MITLQISLAQAGVQPPTLLGWSTEARGWPAVDVQETARPDDLQWWSGAPASGHDLSPAQRERALHEPDDGYLDIVREERFQVVIDELCGGLDVHEEHAWDSMLDRGEHYRKITNTILRQREVGYCHQQTG